MTPVEIKILSLAAGFLVCAVGAIYFFYKLLECDNACQINKARQAEQERIRNLPPPPPPPLPPPPKVYATNTSQFCNGEVVVELVSARKQFNPNNCAWIFEVLESRMRIGRSMFIAEAWSDVGPEGLGDKSPQQFDFYEPAPGQRSAKWRYMLCDQQSASMKQWKCAAESTSPSPTRPSPSPQSTNVSAECPGEVTERWERPGQYRNFPTGGFRGDGWNAHKNPCAVYFRIQEGTMAFGTDSGVGVYNAPHQSKGFMPQGPMTFDLVAGVDRPARWTFILCRQWHPAMKEWRCN